MRKNIKKMLIKKGVKKASNHTLEVWNGAYRECDDRLTKNLLHAVHCKNVLSGKVDEA